MTTTLPQNSVASDVAHASILLVDDEKELLEVNADILRDMGATVEIGHTPTQAKIKIRHKKFDLIVMDVNLTNNLEKQEGLVLAEQRSKTRNADTPVILITGNHSAALEERVAMANKVTVLEKGTFNFIEMVTDAIAKQKIQLG